MKEVLITGGALLTVLIFVFVAFLSFGDNIEEQSTQRQIDSIFVEVDSLKVIDSSILETIEATTGTVEANANKINLLTRQIGELSFRTLESETQIENLEARVDTLQ